MSNIWLTSDFHINHANLCRGTTKWEDTRGCRDFDNPTEMENELVKNLNEMVGPDDILYNLGDVIFGNVEYLPTFLNRLNCKNIHLIWGNHDHKIKKSDKLTKLFTSTQKELSLQVDNNVLFLSHYPNYHDWPGKSNGSFHLFGHQHCNLADDKDILNLDVGVDGCWYGHRKFSPWSLDEVLNVMHNIKSPVSHKF